MTNRLLTISRGTDHPAKIRVVESLDWATFAEQLTRKPIEVTDKSSAGWFIPAHFEPSYRDSEHLVSREALTFDYDSITAQDIVTIKQAFKPFAYCVFTTASHTAEKPRIRVVMPLSRAATPDEFCAVSRKVAALAGIELAARESHVPAQMAYWPTRKPGAEHASKVHTGAWVDVDTVLAEYQDWTDRSQWPKRKDHDSTYKSDELPTPAREKPGVIGAFNRAFSITEAIAKFELPYSPVSE